MNLNSSILYLLHNKGVKILNPESVGIGDHVDLERISGQEVFSASFLDFPENPFDRTPSMSYCSDG